jgi:hypothetical protein
MNMSIAYDVQIDISNNETTYFKSKEKIQEYIIGLARVTNRERVDDCFLFERDYGISLFQSLDVGHISGLFSKEGLGLINFIVFPNDQSGSLDNIHSYTQAFFCLPEDAGLNHVEVKAKQRGI